MQLWYERYAQQDHARDDDLPSGRLIRGVGPSTCLESPRILPGVFLRRSTHHTFTIAMHDNHDLGHLRHSLAHLLAAAVLELYPDAKRAIGPAIEDGFYFDFEFSAPVSDEDLPAIEARMREILKGWKSCERRELGEEEARAEFPGNPYKLELIDEIVAKGEPLSFYRSGSYEDLCRGGHVDDLSGYDPKAFALTKVAGAYWRGDERNAMLTRIYGVAFPTRAELRAYRERLAEAAKRDHRVLGKRLDLFAFSPLVGPGLPLWTPKGTVLRHELDRFVWDLRRARGYERVEIPHITKKDLYEKSGHWAKFSDELLKVTTREGHEFVMKPMNCPHHAQIYARKPWSYRELPQRYANTTMVYRDEQSGELGGLNRVLSITQDDAHVFCRLSQAKEEASRVWDIIEELYGTFGFELRVRLSTRDPEAPDAYLGSSDQWTAAETLLGELARERGIITLPGEGEAAFYGPKLDFMAQDALGRAHQVATIQFDFNQPERFDLDCVAEDGSKERIVMIHAAILGSIERFLAVLIEHVAGEFPVWLAPVQVRVLPISETFQGYAESVMDVLAKSEMRPELAEASESLGKRIRAAEMDKVPYTVVVGEKEAAAGTVSVRDNRDGSQASLDLHEFVRKLAIDVKKRV